MNEYCAVNGNDGSLRAGPLRKKRATANNVSEVEDHPRALSEPAEQSAPSSSDQPPVIHKRRPWGPYNAELPAFDPARHKRYVNTLLARDNDRATEEEARYGKPPTGKLTYTPLELQVVELKERYQASNPSQAYHTYNTEIDHEKGTAGIKSCKPPEGKVYDIETNLYIENKE